MSEEVGYMRDALQAAIEQFLVTKGGGFISGFVYAIDVVDSEGQKVKYLGGPLEQDTGTSLGLTSYLDKWYDTEARELIAASSECHGDCCNGDDD